MKTTENFPKLLKTNLLILFPLGESYIICTNSPQQNTQNRKNNQNKCLNWEMGV